MNNYFYGSEMILEYDNIDEAIRDLRRYVEDDDLYYQYVNKTKEKFDDVEIYNINHTLAIQKVLQEFKLLQKEMEKVKKDENIIEQEI